MSWSKGRKGNYFVLLIFIVIAVFFLIHTPLAPETPYDLPLVLNLRSYLSPYTAATRNNARLNKFIRDTASLHPDSILSHYVRSSSQQCERLPYRPFLRKALDRYGAIRRLQFPWKNASLVVQITSETGAALSKDFVEGCVEMASKFDHVIIVALGDPASTAANSKQLKRAFKEAGLEPSVQFHSPRLVDEAIYFMSRATHIIVHRGEISAFIALVSKGTVYYSKAFKEYMDVNEFRWLVSKSQPLYTEKLRPSVTSGDLERREKLSNMGDVQPSCCTFEAYGVGDGEKIICTNAKAFRKEPCWVLSVGCAGKWSFEESIVARTNCFVHTFDCTGTWEIPDAIKDRVKLHPICLGATNMGQYRTWADIIRIGSEESGVADGKLMPALAKMDIEGFEFPVLDALYDQRVSEMLPEQLAMELHVLTKRNVGGRWIRNDKSGISNMDGEDVEDLFNKLRDMGYVLVHRADNPRCYHCSEVTLVRKTSLPRGGEV